MRPILSPRERQTLAMFAEGYSQPEIAHRLGVSVKSVETFYARAKRKMRLQSRVDVVRFAFRRGWLFPRLKRKVPAR